MFDINVIINLTCTIISEIFIGESGEISHETDAIFSAISSSEYLDKQSNMTFLSIEA